MNCANGVGESLVDGVALYRVRETNVRTNIAAVSDDVDVGSRVLPDVLCSPKLGGNIVSHDVAFFWRQTGSHI